MNNADQKKTPTRLTKLSYLAASEKVFQRTRLEAIVSVD